MFDKLSENNKQIAEEFLTSQIMTTGRLSGSRDHLIETSLHILEPFLIRKDGSTMCYSELSTEKLQRVYVEYLESANVSDSTLDVTSRYLITFFKWLLTSGTNPNLDPKIVHSLKPHSRRAPMVKADEILTEEELQTVLTMKDSRDNFLCDSNMRCVIACLFGSGLRISEVLRLKLSDVGFSEFDGKRYIRMEVTDEKTNKIRLGIVTNPFLIYQLEKHLKIKVDADGKPFEDKSKIYFVSLSEKPYPMSTVISRFRKLNKYRKNYGIYKKLHTHMGRKYYITWNMRNGIPLEVTSMVTHGSISSPSLKHYLHMNEQTIVKALLNGK